MDGWWFIQNMSWLNNMNFKNIVWFIKALFNNLFQCYENIQNMKYLLHNSDLLGCIL